MGALETLVASARERAATERSREIRERADLEAIRRQRDVEKVREIASRTFTPELLRQLSPTYEPGRGNIRPSMRFNIRGIRFNLNWREFLWAEPGHQDYFESRTADGAVAHFSPEFPNNDEKLAVLIDGYTTQRSWLRFLLPKS